MLLVAAASRRLADAALSILRRTRSTVIGYIQARRHRVSRPMREFTSWLFYREGRITRAISSNTLEAIKRVRHGASSLPRP
jgi:hypothetical protein